MHKKQILWWGRSDRGYSRNGIVIKALEELGFEIIPFFPKTSLFAFEEAFFKRLPSPDLIWVPCFRQRDFFTAYRYAHMQKIPIIFDPLISSYDKKVFEHKKWKENSPKAHQLKQKESKMFQQADLVLADTQLHANFFVKTFKIERSKIEIVPVGADEDLFTPQPPPNNATPRILFYGSYVPLQGVDIIIEAARKIPYAQWILIGNGKLRKHCEKQARELDHVAFINWIPYESLPKKIGTADILLGIFGTTHKAERVIPNKVYQSLACGRPVITRESNVYSKELLTDGRGIRFIPPGSSDALASCIQEMLKHQDTLATDGQIARNLFNNSASFQLIKSRLTAMLMNPALHLYKHP